MITAIAEKLTNKLLSNGYLAAAEKEEIAYGLFTFFSRCFFLLICVFWGLMFRRFYESLIFYFTFLFIKKFAGGYHASTEIKCIILSSISILFSVFSICIYITIESSYPFVVVIAIIAGSIIWLLAPVEAKEKPLTNDEKKLFKRNTFIRLLIIISIISLFYNLSCTNVCIAVDVGLVLELILLIMGKIKEYNSIKFV